MNISKKLFQTFKKKAKKILPNEVKAFLKDQLKGFKSEELNISDSGKKSGNFIAIDGIVFKRLSSVEADKKKSNQHEFNGSNYLKELLGKAEPKEFRVNFAWIESSDICLLEEGFVTWYDARRSHPSRSEYRLYFKDNVISKRFSVNDPLFLIKRDDRNLLLISTKAYSTVESQLLYLFALDNNNFENKRNSRDVFQKGEILDFEFKSRALDDYVLECFRESSKDKKKNQSFLEPIEDEPVALAEEIEPIEEESVALAEEIEQIPEDISRQFEEPKSSEVISSLTEEKELEDIKNRKLKDTKKFFRNLNFQDQLLKLQDDFSSKNLKKNEIPQETNIQSLEVNSQDSEEINNIPILQTNDDINFEKNEDISSINDSVDEIEIDESQNNFLSLIESKTFFSLCDA